MRRERQRGLRVLQQFEMPGYGVYAVGVEHYRLIEFGDQIPDQMRRLLVLRYAGAYGGNVDLLRQYQKLFFRE